MLVITPSVLIYLHADLIDMRKSFAGLFGTIRADLQRDVRNGGLFMFINSRCNRIKLMYWDTDGIAIWMERLDQGWFHRPLRCTDGNLGKAFDCLRNHWDAWNVYTKDRALPIDNNQVRRLVKRIAIGHKNCLFIGNLWAGIRDASLMYRCTLESVLTHRIQGTARLEELLPYRWWAHHAEAVQKYQEQERRDKADVASVHAAKLRKKKQNPTYPPAHPPNVHCFKNVAVRFQIPSVVARILWSGPNTRDVTFSCRMRTIHSSPSVSIRNLVASTVILCSVNSQYKSAVKPRLNSQTIRDVQFSRTAEHTLCAGYLPIDVHWWVTRSLHPTVISNRSAWGIKR